MKSPTERAEEFGKSIKGNEKAIGILKGILQQMKPIQDALFGNHEKSQEFLDNACFIQFLREAIEASEEQ